MDVDPDGSFVDAASGDHFMLDDPDHEEEAKQPSPPVVVSNIHMSGDSNRIVENRSRATRAQRARMSSVLDRIDNYNEAEHSRTQTGGHL